MILTPDIQISHSLNTDLNHYVCWAVVFSRLGSRQWWIENCHSAWWMSSKFNARASSVCIDFSVLRALLTRSRLSSTTCWCWRNEVQESHLWRDDEWEMTVLGEFEFYLRSRLCVLLLFANEEKNRSFFSLSFFSLLTDLTYITLQNRKKNFLVVCMLCASHNFHHPHFEYILNRSLSPGSSKK